MLSGLAGATSVSCAVSVPISLSSSSLSGDRGELKIGKCENENYSEKIFVGEELNSELCWRLSAPEEGDDLSEKMSYISGESQLNKFFSEIWKAGSGDVNVEGWKNECIESGKGWRVKDSKIVGYCGSSDLSTQNTTFVDISKGETAMNFSICLKGKDCWADDFNAESISEFKTKDAVKWKDISFFKKVREN
ncbi:hypothetical protein [Candidatus Mycoplasma haematominutum]|uniref:hypothetical protein n=1 Tax=Candidatus Mycoplasma haematominutum TaxID=209446 RepID=UPI0011B43F13|nr:hypothetical protein [Candidatus Mycoplasma haematominutum]